MRDPVAYLVARSLLPQEQAEGATVIQEWRRNENYKVVCEPGPSFFLKHTEEANAASLACEARAYTLLCDGGSFSRYLPRSYGYDSAQRVLTLELIPDAHALGEYYRRLGRFPVALATRLAEALAELHKMALPGDDLPFAPPLALSLHRPALESLRVISPGNVELIRKLQQTPEIAGALDALRNEWRVATFIHGDLRWENCLRSRHSGLKLIDWELAGHGDPAWDVGCVFAEYLRFWVLSMPLQSRSAPESTSDEARYPLEKMQPAIRSFWTTYRAKRELGRDEAMRLLFRSVQFMAARLMEIAFARLLASSTVTSEAGLLLELALNILRLPREAATHLMGISLAPGPHGD